MAGNVFWRRRYVELSSDKISYFASDPSKRQLGEGMRGALQVTEVDDVAVRGREVNVHFASFQRAGKYDRQRDALSFLAADEEEALDWAAAVRQAAADRLHDVLPVGWDVSTMLSNAGPVRRVAKVELSSEARQLVQHLVDHSFICKRTRDRKGGEVPVRLEVAKVLCVQNVAAWMAYDRAREKVHARGRKASPLVPEVLTGSLGCRGALGELDEAANEQWLFHGTTVAAAQGITDSEFRMDLAGTHRGSLYGKAVYLAECSSKADEYSEEDSEGLCRMLLCRATLGAVFVEREKQPSVQELEEKCKQYDSLCGDRWAAVGTFREFVLYDGSQVYPEYIIHYRRTMQGDLLGAIGAISPTDCKTDVRWLIPHAARLAQTHPDPQVRYRISLLLGAHAITVVPVLTECLKDETALRRQTAASALGHIADFTSLARSHFDSVTEETREQTRGYLPLATAVPDLILCLRDVNDGVRRAAAEALEQIGGPAATAVPALAECLRDPSQDVRCAAVKALARLGAENQGAAALAALGGYATTPSTVAALCDRLRDSHEGVRSAAALALGRLRCSSAVPALTEGLRDANADVRRASATALGEIGPNAAAAIPTRGYLPLVTAVPDLMLCLSDLNEGVRKAAAEALEQIGGPAASAVPALADCLRDPSQDVRCAAVRALARLGAEKQGAGAQGPVLTALGDYTSAPSTVAALCDCLRDSHEGVRSAAALALGRLGCSSAVPALTEGLKDANEDVRKASAHALGVIGPNAAAAIPHLVKSLKDSSEDVRKAAAASLGLFGPAASVAVPALLQCLSDTNVPARKAAATALGQVGICTWGVTNALKQRLKDPNEGVRRAAVKTLELLELKRNDLASQSGDAEE